MPVEGEYVRVRTPKKDEIIGIVIGRVGGSRFIVNCNDGKERMCRIPGRIRHQVWVKENDYVIIQPWSIEGDKKGDIIWRYTRVQAEWLKRQGYLKDF